jgi:hypothetical protein
MARKNRQITEVTSAAMGPAPSVERVLQMTSSMTMKMIKRPQMSKKMETMIIFLV